MTVPVLQTNFINIIGTPRHQHPMDAIVERACREAALYQELGLDGVLVENMHDVPYLRGSVGPEITAGMARVCSEVRRAVPKLPLGVQILSGIEAHFHNQCSR